MLIARYSIQKRISANRNGLVPCYRHSTNDNQLAQNGTILQAVFHHYARYLLEIPAQVLVGLVTLAILAVSVWGNIELRQEFNPMWFLPRDSYLAQWSQNQQKYFPSQGELVHVFFTDMQMPEELEKLDQVVRELQNQTDIISHVDCWLTSFQTYYRSHFEGNPLQLDENTFKKRLTQFLFSPSGSKHRMMFKYQKPISCGNSAPQILVSRFMLMIYGVDTLAY